MFVPPSTELRTAIQTTFQDWHRPEKPPSTLLAGLRLVANQRAVQLEQSGVAPDNRQLVQQVLANALVELEKTEERHGQILRLRFLELFAAKEVATKLKLGNRDKANRLQDKALEAITQSILQQETAAQQQYRLAQENHLPPRQYAQLFGVEPLQAQAWQQITQPNEAWITALVGLGGIGKTALADALARQAITAGLFAQVLWVRANPQPRLPETSITEQVLAELALALWPTEAEIAQPQERLRRLRQALQTQPHLIIIDNVEAVSDTTHLLEHLSNLVNPSKFLITTRARPSGQYPVFALGVDELPEPEAHALVRQQARASGNPALAEALEEQLAAIYQMVGGNPLALKLVVNLAAVQPLPDILAGLATSRVGSIDNLYRHIYLKAWQALSEPARALLQAMPLVAGTGGGSEQLQHISGLTEDVFWVALEELTARALVEPRGTLTQRRYGIHRLTDTFLRIEIIHWPEDADL